MKTLCSGALKVLLLVVMVCAVCSCGKDKDASDVYIPDINGNWLNQQNGNEQISFFDAPNNAATGTFSGNDFVNNVVVATLSGSFNHSKITFVLTPSDAGKAPQTYNGTIAGLANPTMALTSGGKSLNLKKQ